MRRLHGRLHDGALTDLLILWVYWSLAACTMNNNGENMHSCETPRASRNPWSIDSRLELEQRPNSLSSLVCDLLRSNQELRHALLEATANTRHDQEWEDEPTKMSSKYPA
jgi:hypothetical protein